MPTPSLELKGSTFTFSVLYINSSDIDQFSTELAAKVAQAPQFFSQAPVVVHLGHEQAQRLDVNRVLQQVAAQGFIVVGITAASNKQTEQAKGLGVAVVKIGKEAVCPPPPPRTTKIVKQNVRSGQQIYAKDGDLIVFGAVGNGAEVIADGNIHIYGSLRGKAMAGANGDRHAIILAHDLQAELVSIAGQYWLSENLQQFSDIKSGCIRLDGESLIVESLPV
ncbi:septum site-determining protein MinC [Shewanella sp. NIFS-20-20]|uniref:septum site-determining protein MinC n=1 Tax=Shewanella sp. NIFS-20-20 TaxID=2853806 RepID=UPI001C46C988|nr:septum site-determining protein MinC [Shewanella sp. NIFS-20-20]MBV7314419.1 septum site-determining protein MinC [Shewanella sp. NIFS-20-20]